MKVALVHDYLREYGGAERVLEAFHQLWPRAPIYTAFKVNHSSAGKAFADARVIESWLAPLLKFKNLYSPLRFLIPLIWQSFDLKAYDLVIASSSWYITRGFKTGPQTKVVCYCHTPPRYLYGYQTSVEWQRYLPVKIYGRLISHFLRLYDFKTAQKVDQFIVNSENVAQRVKKFYRRSSTVVYPPVEVSKIIQATKSLRPQDYYLLVSRVVGAKGIKLAVRAAQKAGVRLKIIGEQAGLSWFNKDIKDLAIKGKRVEFLGRVSDQQLWQYYGQCRAFLALAKDEDFGITPVEAMAAGRPVIAFKGGGYLESVKEGKTGLFIDKLTVAGLAKVLKQFKAEKFTSQDCRLQAEKFSKQKFKKKIRNLIKPV